MTDTSDDELPSTGSPEDLHTRLASGRRGRIAITVAVVVIAVWIVGPNLPASAARDRLDVLWWPMPRIGFNQNWEVFSPDPRDQTLDVRARIEHADGTVEWWDVPDFDPVVGSFREYRWNKWQERVRLDAREDLWDPTAEWVAERHRRDGQLPDRVTLIRRWIDHGPLTEDGRTDSDWNEFEFHVWAHGR